ncbi:MAG: phosphatase PAP2 family protein [Ignavibacteriales bacterium]|nr:phosphatase PAP2 family protein [Ignavibacteriales bacterium]
MSNNTDKSSNRTSLIKVDLISLFNDSSAFIKAPLNWTRKTRTTIFIFFIFFFISMFFIDNNLRVWIQSARNPFFDSVFSFFHRYGKAQPVLILFLVFYIGGLLFQKEKIRSTGYKFLQLFIYSGLIVTILKSFLGRWRPFNGVGQLYFTPFVLGPNERLSLPSGDVAIAFVISSVFASLYDNILWKSFWYFIAVMTAIGRIYHDQHWLSDTLLSAFIVVSIGVWQNHLTQLKSSAKEIS